MSYWYHIVHLTPEGKLWKPDDEWPENGLIPLGTRAEIHRIIAKLFPEAKFTDPFWIPVIDMEIVLDHQEPVRYISLRHGFYEACKKFHDETGWDAFDPVNKWVEFK
jgi:hypothetical protein